MNSNVWNSIKKKLLVRINPVLVRVWVEPLSARYEDGIVQLTAPNEFVMKWVQDHLLDRIKDAAQEVLEAKVGVTIDLESGKADSPREFISDVTAYYAVDEILDSINRLTSIVRSSYPVDCGAEDSPSEAEEFAAELEVQTFDSILDAVLESFGVAFRELMMQENEHAVLARRALYYLCFRYGIPAEEVALNIDCTVSEVREGAKVLENEISEAIDNGEDLDELLLRIFQK
ncbi:DnaA N-terminal domain-containing protein [Maridesulfovibrio sp.]|jgi:chromosomal replication initiation ATPase DnaA|uniref:DnaA N-terminal domain-containing protein n=1 Tax=Maridesulfovibrio sp. TaxID=2795000 RepID=UPI0029C9DED3|nr:DnaA N-terminal domain-containing protein [Maridesulfovibrio sp.]